jgi:hypothetical protein
VAWGRPRAGSSAPRLPPSPSPTQVSPICPPTQPTTSKRTSAGRRILAPPPGRILQARRPGAAKPLNSNQTTCWERPRRVLDLGHPRSRDSGAQKRGFRCQSVSGTSRLVAERLLGKIWARPGVTLIASCCPRSFWSGPDRGWPGPVPRSPAGAGGRELQQVHQFRPVCRQEHPRERYSNSAAEHSSATKHRNFKSSLTNS